MERRKRREGGAPINGRLGAAFRFANLKEFGKKEARAQYSRILSVKGEPPKQYPNPGENEEGEI